MKSVKFNGSWIWHDGDKMIRNDFVRFRKSFRYNGGKAIIHITADSRYVLHINGQYIGQGPVRAWPNHYRYDTYDITPYLIKGNNTVCALVNHYGESNFQYISSTPGLLAQIELDNSIIITDSSWRVSQDTAFISQTPRISVQEAFEEQFDAEKYDGWLNCDYDDSRWKLATVICGAEEGEHKNLEHRAIPMLTMEPVTVQRIVSAEYVKPLPYHFTLNLEKMITPDDHLSNRTVANGCFVTFVTAKEDCTLRIAHCSFDHAPQVSLNGEQMRKTELNLKKGTNTLLIKPPVSCHLHEYIFVFDGPEDLAFDSTLGSEWAYAGPFGINAQQAEDASNDMDESLLIAKPLHDFMTFEYGEEFFRSKDIKEYLNKGTIRPILGSDAPKADIFAACYTEKVTGNANDAVANIDGLLNLNEWTVVSPNKDGSDVRILLDFGKEVVGYHEFEVNAPSGTIIDFHNFEFIQPDGRYNFAEGMHNSFRYICCEGTQSYRTLHYRGFQYSYLTIRNLTGPVKIKRVQVLFASYPQSRKGYFKSSDEMLNRIWEVGAHSLRCCAEDTYVDCPTYEQTHWVGDARNEALVDWVINGDSRLWFRCLEQTGDSLERSVITESNVPSGWVDILPSWSLLWMRSCAEYLKFTGDIEKSQKLLGFIKKNVEGIKKNINKDGLFEMRAWNMFDWADMDVPSRCVATHLNCFLVLSLHEAADMARKLGENRLALQWDKFAGEVDEATNKHLWNEEKRAYTDSIRRGEQSPVFSQQTQTAAYMSGVAKNERAAFCRDAMYNPPEGFVKAGSPFFEFFLLEGFQRENRVADFLNAIRRDWGFMVETGASTFWEMWSWGAAYDGRRLTRSHCHGWSAAPTYFLSTYVLGITPNEIGFKTAIIEPHFGDLRFCRGSMPTPYGEIEVQWYVIDGKIDVKIMAPKDIELIVKLPENAKYSIVKA